MPEINAEINTEVLILRNPLYYKVAAPEAFEVMIKDGSWLPLVLGTLRAVVERHFFELCELNWDYINVESKAPEGYDRYKSCFSKNLNDEQAALVRNVADEIESELAIAAQETLASRESDDGYEE